MVTDTSHTANNQGSPPKENRGLASIFTLNNQSIWTDVQYWRRLCPSLTIANDDMKQKCNSNLGGELPETDTAEKERRRERLVEDGYVLVDDAISVEQNAKTQLVKAAIASLHEKNCYPATFILLYDEAWELARVANKVLSSSTHPSNRFNFDIIAWYVNPREKMAGFSPHRDRQTTDVAASFNNDLQAKYVTMWMALSDATPENSCLYVIPKQHDPGYTEGDDEGAAGENNNEKVQDPLKRALASKESFQNIRALPRQAGQSVLFTHRIMHWGSRGNPKSVPNGPRIAISFVSSDPEFERPYLSPEYFSQDTNPPFHIRLLLVCAQLLIYYQRFDLPKECVRACYEYCKMYSHELDESYRRKVFVEFVKAMKEATSNNDQADDFNGKENPSEIRKDDNIKAFDSNGDNEEDEDAMLEEMLDAEAGGYGEFEDDYDEIASDDKERDSAPENEGNDSSEDDEGGSVFGKHGLLGDNSEQTIKKRKAR